MFDPISNTPVGENSDVRQPDLNPQPLQDCPDTASEAKSFKFEVEDKGFLDMINDMFSGALF